MFLSSLSQGFDGSVKCVEFLPQSLDFLVLVEDGSMRRVDAGTGRTLRQISTGGVLHSVRTDGFTAIGVGEEGVVRGWRLRDDEEVMRLQTAGNQVAIAVNDDASLICVANQKATIYQRAVTAHV